MNFAQYKVEGGGGMFLKWSESSEKNPFRFKIAGEPDKENFRGKTKYKLPIVVPGGNKKVLDLSQRALNQLIEAAQNYGVLETIHKAVWIAWVEGESYETTYHWTIEGMPAPEKRQPIQVVKEQAPYEFSAATADSEFGSVDEDSLPF